MTCVRHQTHLYLNLIGICAITNDNDISFVWNSLRELIKTTYDMFMSCFENIYTSHIKLFIAYMKTIQLLFQRSHIEL